MSYIRLVGEDHPTALEVKVVNGEFLFLIRDHAGRTVGETFLSVYKADVLGRFLLDELEEELR